VKLLRFLINTNLFISLAAVAFTMQAQIQLGMRPAFHPYLFIIFFATLFEYNLHRLITLAYHKNALKSPKHQWLREHKKAFYVLVAISIIGFVVSICLAKREVLLALLPIAFMTLFYTLPIYRVKQRLLRLREIPGLKIFLISFVWAAVTVLLPVIQSDQDFDLTHIATMIAERFFFVFAITVPFDIRDMAVDKWAGLKTIPVIYGVEKSIRYASASVLFFMVIAFFHYSSMGLYDQVLACSVSGVITLISIRSPRLQALPFYHYGILDGAMIIQPLLSAFFYYVL
jgi:4-hydroxybenzoate polyprenyltransferase